MSNHGAAPRDTLEVTSATGDTSVTDSAAIVDRAITTRRSIRAFLDTPVPRETVEDILAVASRAPSGTNTQPWRVYVLAGDAKARLCADVLAAYDDPERDTKYREEYPYYPREWVNPYLARRRKVGWDLYGLLEISREDKARMHEQHARNFRFFDAPVGLIFTIDRIMEQGSWLDYGMFLQSIMVAARARGLDTCPQAAFTQFHGVLASQLQLTENEMVVCGMSLGYADPEATANQLVTEREPVSGFARFLS
ncbi:Nitroreductase [Cupriavidus sp. OV038]|jgi:nitroreductase|uniref:nitroreductase n=1 Tax=unclassified Cupriavidus TaxID=2640874 RepID=UPI0008EC870D|nr:MULTISPECIES: nitroreductase [unclassified Cupriavidus]SFB93631.1 Nitroreductase [Cupriavidus sp. OV038]SFO96535.1 Nitroreductase [Cupriavidus sp. OV096]